MKLFNASNLWANRRLLLTAAGLAAAFLAGGVHAQAAWQTHPLKFVVPYPAGGNADAVAR